ncbi:MAG: radical SAM protein [Desulfuromonadaceae bacterium]|nr:radical SAM protein [Desulfuromonadaceae bacterium]MDD2854336.1 radical SAM protein [Desulfuromonadaceae bacterium]
MITEQNSEQTLRRIAAIPQPHEAEQNLPLSVALLVPPSVFVVPRGWEWTHTAPFEGPSILAALIKGLGYPFRLLDQREQFDPEDVRGLADGFDIVGISVWGDSFNYVRRAVEILKEENPSRPVILGGPLATAIPQLLLETTRADIVVAGEGEVTLTELLDYFSGNEWAKSLWQIPGVIWRDSEGQIRINPPRQQLADLDVLPFQDFSVWERFDGKEIPEIYLSYSRGCACNCTFCFRAFPSLNYKSVKRVKREIDYYSARGFRMAWWNDLTFVTDRTYVKSLMNTIFADHKFRWTAFSRVTGMDEETLLLMKENGLDIVLYGMESVSPAVLENYHKGISRNAMIDTIQLHRKCGVKIGGLFIVGSPEDNQQSMDELRAFCNEFKEVTRVKYLSALPGTEFYRQALRDGLIRDEVAHLEWLSREQSIEEDIEQPGFVKFTGHLTTEELRAVYRDINYRIEVRPYDYTNGGNVYLKEAEKFITRKPGEN